MAGIARSFQKSQEPKGFGPNSAWWIFARASGVEPVDAPLLRNITKLNICSGKRLLPAITFTTFLRFARMQTRILLKNLYKQSRRIHLFAAI
jgi:hypothetical protein